MLIIFFKYFYYRSKMRDGLSEFDDLSWVIWAALFLFPLIGYILGIYLNDSDEKLYRRYLQFLRLEFDTRLGMHSPR